MFNRILKTTDDNHRHQHCCEREKRKNKSICTTMRQGEKTRK